MNIALQRLYNQHVSRPQYLHPADVVRWLGAVQAQDYLGALWAVGLRLPQATEASIEQAIAAGSIIRTWPMRGTLHFVVPEDVRWMLQLLTPRILAASAGRHRQLQLDARVFGRSAELMHEALQGGKQLTRPEIYQVLAQANIATAGSRGLHILSYQAQQGLICFGPRRGKQPTFTLLEEWVPASRAWDPEEALLELTRRYFRSHGPASLHDFAWWSGLKVSDARLGIQMAAGQLAATEVLGQTYWFAPDQAPAPEAPAPGLLLPFFDEFTVAYKDRRAMLDPRFDKLLNAGGGLLNPVMVTESQIVGTWKRKLKPRSVTLAFQPFRDLAPDQVEAFSAAAFRYGCFLQLPVALNW